MAPGGECQIQLIVGLGNPGADYSHTRHNAGAWFIERLVQDAGITFKAEPKFHGKVGLLSGYEKPLRLLLPTTFMNASGEAVQALSHFYHIPVQAILIAHDDLDFPPGVVRFKQGGGHGGHNGLRDIIQHLQTADFSRLRIGIGHPGDRSQVLNFVLSRPSKADLALILSGIDKAIDVLPAFIAGETQKAITQLHS